MTEELYPDFTITRMGECRIPSPLKLGGFTHDDQRVLFRTSLASVRSSAAAGEDPPSMEVAGPREKIYFDPSKLKCGIVTCGGICPGLNDVIRAIVLSLYHHYGVKKVFGLKFGFEGLSYRYGHEPVELTPDSVEGINDKGGTILGSSRGSQDVGEMVDTLEQMNIGLLFTIGGDGTLKGARRISEEVTRRGLKVGVIGIPKTIDNDILYIEKSFGFETAVAEAKRATSAANVEATGARNGVGLLKLMGRESGFISATTVLCDSNVNFCLIPEVPFTLEGFLGALRERVEKRGHAVVIVAEGAGQDLLQATGERDASGNVRFADIGLFLKSAISDYFQRQKVELNLKYIDPSYTIRSLSANAHDSAFCLLLGHNAVHAGMTGRTNMVVGFSHGTFTHVPIPLAVSGRKKVDPDSGLWSSVLSTTGQAAVL
jgi:6-phosphofructokinase 1